MTPQQALTHFVSPLPPPTPFDEMPEEELERMYQTANDARTFFINALGQADESDAPSKAEKVASLITRRANLRGADLWGAKNIISFGPVGEERRIGFANLHKKDGNHFCMVRLGCFWDTQEKAVEAIRKKYGENSTYEALVNAACAVLLEGLEETTAVASGHSPFNKPKNQTPQ